MKMKRHIAAALAALTATISCQHKELCYDHPHNGSLNVVFDWTKAQEPVGQNMELFLFPVISPENPIRPESGVFRPLHYQFYDIHGGTIEVPSGAYRAICVNTGTGANRFTDDSDDFEDFTVTTRAAGKADDSILEPDILYSDHTLAVIGIEDKVQQTLVMYPVQRTPRYTVIVKNIHNLGGARGCQATLSSLSCCYLEVPCLPSDASHTQTLDMARAGETVLAGQITIFGHRHSECMDHILTLSFTLLDGQQYTVTADVSGRMDELSREGRMSGDIEVDLDIEIPKPISNGSGFQPTVDGWEGEYIDLSM